MTITYTPDREGRKALHDAMRGRKVIVDEIPHSHAAARQLLFDGLTLEPIYEDVQSLKLAIRWED